jgi:hypothetical protein
MNERVRVRARFLPLPETVIGSIHGPESKPIHVWREDLHF